MRLTFNWRDELKRVFEVLNAANQQYERCNSLVLHLQRMVGSINRFVGGMEYQFKLGDLVKYRDPLGPEKGIGLIVDIIKNANIIENTLYDQFHVYIEIGTLELFNSYELEVINND